MKISDCEQMPTVEAIMQPSPYFAQTNDSVSKILDLMRKHKIRHIPIKQGEQIVGIISERDLRWMETPAMSLPDPEEIPVHPEQLQGAPFVAGQPHRSLALAALCPALHGSLPAPRIVTRRSSSWESRPGRGRSRR